MPSWMFRLTGILCCLTPGLAAEDQAPNWVRVTEHAAWKARDSQGEVVYRDKLWIFGGWVNSFEDPPRDVWSSADGVEWKLVTQEAAWKHSDLPTSIVFKDRMWMMGGWHGGRLKHASGSSAVWSSTDGAEWKQETEKAGWSPRLGAAAVVFKDKLYLMGGNHQYYYGTDADLLNDVWSTADGVKWERLTEHAGWAPRAYHAAVVHDGKIWVCGGGNYQPGYKAFNDVWSSTDGVEWTRVSEHAPWSPRIWFSAEVYRDRMWVLGGWSNNPSKNWNDVWYSQDGAEWTQLKTADVWYPRHEHSVFLLKDKLWVTAGNSPLANDVWQLEVPADWFKSKP